MLNETPMLFPMAPAEFWKQIKSTIEEVVNEKINQQFQPPPTDHLPEKALLKLSDVCAVFQVSNQHSMIGSDKIKSRALKLNRDDIFLEQILKP